jgi:hypothetical protein
LSQHDPFAGAVSPSLVSGNGLGPAFELKFLVEEPVARIIKEWSRQLLALDPHGDPSREGAYQTASIYTDTPELDVYLRSQTYRRSKYRVRSYGSCSAYFLERKSKSGDRVAKRRSAIPTDDLAVLKQPASALEWVGHWFHQRLIAKRLQPACQISYDRTAFVGMSATGPVRLTLDQRIVGVLANEWSFRPVDGGLRLLSGKVIVEFKYRSALPILFKGLIMDLRLSPTPVSKYRLCREACGVTPLRRGSIDA